MFGFQAMLKGIHPVSAKIIPAVAGPEVLILEEMRASGPCELLRKEVDQVLLLSKRVHLDGMLDSRIRDTRDLIDRHPPTRSAGHAR